jgi:hypothetical protein
MNLSHSFVAWTNTNMRSTSLRSKAFRHSAAVLGAKLGMLARFAGVDLRHFMLCLVIFFAPWRVEAQTLYISTIAGGGNNGEGGQVTSAYDVAVDGAGNVYFVGDYRLRKIAANTNIITSVAGNGIAGQSAGTDVLGFSEGVAVDLAGNIYVAESGARPSVVRILKFTFGTVVTAPGQTATTTSMTPVFVNRPDPTNQQFPFALGYAAGIAVDNAGDIYVADYAKSRVGKFSPADYLVDRVTNIAGTGSFGFGGDGAAALLAGLSGPFGVATDRAGNIYVADSGNSRIRKIAVATGIITTVAGNGTVGFAGDGGPATSASLSSPRKLAVDSVGNIYVADSGNNRIRKINAATGIITTVAGNGTAGFSGDGGAATSASLRSPGGLAVDTAGNIYVADTGNNRIRKIGFATPPLPPTSITATAGNGQASVTFSAAVNNGGLPITLYTATSSPGGLTATGTTAPILVTGLTNETAYTFTVTAANGSGTSEPSAVSNSVTPATLPVAPTNITSTAGNAQVTVTFTAPSGNGVSTSYTASCSAIGQPTTTVSGASSPIVVRGLTVGVAYSCTVLARNDVGSSVAAGSPTSVTPLPLAIPITAPIFGDGRSALIWRNADGRVTAWRFVGAASPTGFTDTGTTFGPYPGWTLIASDGDYDGDGKGDLLWQRADGAIAIWLMDGTTVKAQFQAGPYAGWSFFSGNSDFNGDGKSDLIWQRGDGAISLWTMNGGSLINEKTHGPFPGWSLVSATNDFDGDGKADLLWKKNTGAVSLWLMDGVNTKQVSPEYGPYLGWTVMSGSSDYNGDGKTDLTWERTDDSVSVWTMNGVTATTQSSQFGPYAGWRLLAGDRDFDGDGKSDLLWRRTDGAASVWLMSGATMPAQSNISAALLPSGSSWSLLSGYGDFNGDGKTDLVWQSANGQVAVGLANGVIPPTPTLFGPFAGWSHFLGKTIP